MNKSIFEYPLLAQASACAAYNGSARDFCGKKGLVDLSYS
jgi:hypothetical protein